MTQEITVEPLTAAAFAPFGEVIDAAGEPTLFINQGKCARYSDLAGLDIAEGGHTAISIFVSKGFTLPLPLEMVERHPLGSQAFLPMSSDPFLVVAAPDENGAPGQPCAFVTAPGQGINIRRNVWHGVLTPLGGEARFAVVDRVGDGNNLEEHWFGTPYRIVERT